MKKLKKGDAVTVLGRRWFAKTNGNTYHSVNVLVNGKIIDNEPFTYGYGNQYLQTARELLEKHYVLPISNTDSIWKLKDHGINYNYDVVDVNRKKDL